MEIESQPLQPKEKVHEETTGCSMNGLITFVLGLVAGTFSALLCKMAYDTSSAGLDGNEKKFAKPIMMLTLMFLGMSPAVLIWLVQQAYLPKEKRDVISYKTMAILIVPSICDLLCTLLLLVAQLYITASLWQMMRGSIIVITALLKCFALGHSLKIHMWLGVGLITLAMVLVASTSFFAPADAAATANSKDPRVGILLVLVGCIAQGVQYVFEEKVMSVDNAPPLVVIGCEGLWGTVLSLFLVYPLAYAMPGNDNGSFENPFDALTMMQNNSQLLWLSISFVFTVTIYNCAAVYVTKFLSAIWHAILDNFRPITIWALDLAIFYVILPNSGFGEAWVDGSWLQLGGLFILLFGTAVYNGSVWTFSDVNTNGSGYTSLSTSERGDVPADGYIKTEKSMASPSMTRSPLIYNAQGVRESNAAAQQQHLHSNTNKPKNYQSNGKYNEV